MIAIERVLEADGTVALWAVNRTAGDLSGERRFLGYEQPVRAYQSAHKTPIAVCWSDGGTIGHVEIFNRDVLAALPGQNGENVSVGCDIVAAGKMRNGADRWWCRTHQAHWGTKTDIVAAYSTGNLVCSSQTQPVSFVVNPLDLLPDEHAEVGVWCSMPPAITSAGLQVRRRPKIHLHIRDEANGIKIFDNDVSALLIKYGARGDLFSATDTTTVAITPPAAFALVTALEEGRPMGHIDCKNCGAPHLDLGEFSRTAHIKHLCGSCGRDGIRSSEPLISTPLKPLQDHFNPEPVFIDVDRRLSIDDFPGAAFAIWASTPAVLWKADRPQERGIHVHLSVNGKREIDETFGSVIYRGKELKRADLLAVMIQNTLT
ncbi:hypothetical protein FHS52_000938 [Erythromicrobium ramosum]|uniref:Uncharacterized protein n=1 Tax=Erythrobacter ramosus TaxID=35811 RepID=A0ABR6HWI9_9SPHN|nr:hypothetical protein [Erythrobacter ramosus]MBB3774995.1 hypothetical protein [Erythrobacter ramosus]